MPSPLNGFGDFRVVQSKVEKVFEYKYHSTFPDYEPTRYDLHSESVWDGILKQLGVVVAYVPALELEWGRGRLYRKGHMRIEDPMSEYIVTREGTAVRKRHSILYVPDELAMKILVLRELP